MDWIRAAVLGIVQGLTEFLPVSSSGHLELFKFLMRDDALGEESMLMTVVLHAATALSTIIVFRNTIYKLIQKLFEFKNNKESRFVLFILFSMIPAVIVGVLFEDQIESMFSQNIPLVSICLIITGVLLFIADKSKNTEKSVNGFRSFIIGIAQAIAILPGISRSGATISTSVILKVDREEAAKFSFLMVLPLIFGKMAKDILDGSFSSNAEAWPELLVGFIFALITGIIACTWMIKIVKNSKLRYFAYYCFIIAIVGLIFYYNR